MVSETIFESGTGPKQLIGVFCRKGLIGIIEVQYGLVFYNNIIQVIVTLSGPIIFESDDSFVFQTVFLILVATVRFDIRNIRIDDGFDGVGPYVELYIIIVLVCPIFKGQYDKIIDAECGCMCTAVPIQLCSRVERLIVSAIEAVIQ